MPVVAALVAMSLIRLRQVSKRYGRNQVLRDVFYRLGPGDRTGLLGRNGSGKTTALRLILGREEPSGGEIEVAADLRSGYFSQFSELSGEASIESVLREVFEPIRRIEADLANCSPSKRRRFRTVAKRPGTRAEPLPAGLRTSASGRLRARSTPS